MCGCTQSPGRLLPPDWDPPAQAAQALDFLDANDDGLLQTNEMAKAPGLAVGAAHIDQNGDGQLSVSEIEARLELFRQKAVAVRGRRYRLTYRGRPFAGAEVRFVPEPFLEGVIEPGQGMTDATGTVAPAAEINGVTGLRPGYYRVEVTSPRITLPAKFNSSTVLGVEVSLPTDSWDPYGTEELRLVD